MSDPGDFDGKWAEEAHRALTAGTAWLAWEREAGGIGVPHAPSPSLPAAIALETGIPPDVAKAPPRRPEVRGDVPDLPRLQVLEEAVRGCTRCDLHAGRTQTVFARGNPKTRLVFVGKGPGFHEDQQGVPFVGRAGQLLDKMIGAMGLGPNDVYICNVVKCRPPENRTPLPPETAACLPWLEGQLESIRPEVIVALGRCAAETLEAVEPGGRGWRGQWTAWRGTPVMSTYHPAFLLRNEAMKRPVWEDLQAVMTRLGLSPSAKG